MKKILLGAVVLLMGCLMPVGAALDVKLALDQDQYLVIPGTTKAYLKLGIKGGQDLGRVRPGMNVAIVLDRSGSMDGEKIEQAKKAAIYAVGLLGSQDILSLIVYDTEAQVLIPAMKMTNPEYFVRVIEGITAGDSTALFAGVSQGAAQVRKYLDKNRVNRVILLSDGQANVGPDTPGALGDLGGSLRREGISVTTIGLGRGYNEDLMTRLASTSDGNHAFVENAKDLVRIFDAEFKDVLSVAALDVIIRIECRPGVKPLRILGREGDIRGQTILMTLGQVLSSQEKYVLVEVELPAGKAGQALDIAQASISYQDLATKKQESRTAGAQAKFTPSAQVATASVRKDVKEGVYEQLAVEAADEAIKLKDKGEGVKAEQLLRANAATLKKAAEELNSPSLQGLSDMNAAQSEAINNEDWERERKAMKESNFQLQTQQSYK